MGRKRKEEVTTEDVTKMLEEVDFNNKGDLTALLEGPESESYPVVAKSDKPPKYSQEWHDYVMGMFAPDELVNGMPLTDALRRVAQVIYQGFDGTRVKVVKCDRDHAVVQYTILQNRYGNSMEFEDVAECHNDNTDPQFMKYAVATATTRAEGRVLRKLLGLKKVIAAEEVTEDALFTETSSTISGQQVSFLDNLCRKNNINLLKFINSGTLQYKDIAEIPKDTAIKMIGQLSALQNDQSKIKTEIKGYDKDWRVNDGS